MGVKPFIFSFITLIVGLGSAITTKLETYQADKTAEHRDAIKDAFAYAWKGYSDQCFGQDNIKPMTGECDNWLGQGVTLVDSLDTLYIMEMHDEFAKAETWVANNLTFNENKYISFFEDDIRILGGLLGAHSLTNKGIFLTKAKELGEKLQFDFRDDKDFPDAKINFMNKMHYFLEEDATAKPRKHSSAKTGKKSGVEASAKKSGLLGKRLHSSLQANKKAKATIRKVARTTKSTKGTNSTTAEQNALRKLIQTNLKATKELEHMLNATTKANTTAKAAPKKVVKAAPKKAGAQVHANLKATQKKEQTHKVKVAAKAAPKKAAKAAPKKAAKVAPEKNSVKKAGTQIHANLKATQKKEHTHKVNVAAKAAPKKAAVQVHANLKANQKKEHTHKVNVATKATTQKVSGKKTGAHKAAAVEAVHKASGKKSGQEKAHASLKVVKANGKSAGKAAAKAASESSSKGKSTGKATGKKAGDKKAGDKKAAAPKVPQRESVRYRKIQQNPEIETPKPTAAEKKANRGHHSIAHSEEDDTLEYTSYKMEKPKPMKAMMAASDDEEVEESEGESSSKKKHQALPSVAPIVEKGLAGDPNLAQRMVAAHAAKKEAKKSYSIHVTDSLAGIGTFSMEFSYLARASENQTYAETVNKNLLAIYDRQDETLDGLYPVQVDTIHNDIVGQDYSFGTDGDSFYEYLLKTWILNGKQENKYIELYRNAIRGMKDQLLVQEGEAWFVPRMEEGKLKDKFEHLTCFLPGTMALGAYVKANPSDDMNKDDLEVAEEVSDTCVALYETGREGLAPDQISFTEDGEIMPVDNRYLLRPETVESLFYLWRITKKPRYRREGWEIFKAIQSNCRTEYGYTTVVLENDEIEGEDSEPSWFMAETLKYLFLLFSDDNVVPLDKYVFNTEGHPFPILTTK